MRRCGHCHADISDTDPRRKYCSDECRNRYRGSFTCVLDGCEKRSFGNVPCPMHQKRKEVWGDYEIRPPVECGWCHRGFVPLKKYQNYCGEQCRIESKSAYSKVYFSDEVKKAERALRRKLKQTSQQRARKALLAKARYDRYRAFITSHVRRVSDDTPVVSFSAECLEARMSMFGFRCWLCDGAFEAIDHVKPLSMGGPHMLSNLRPICQECNGRKWAIWPFNEVMMKFAVWSQVSGIDIHFAGSRLALKDRVYV